MEVRAEFRHGLPSLNLASSTRHTIDLSLQAYVKFILLIKSISVNCNMLSLHFVFILANYVLQFVVGLQNNYTIRISDAITAAT